MSGLSSVVEMSVRYYLSVSGRSVCLILVLRMNVRSSEMGL